MQNLSTAYPQLVNYVFLAVHVMEIVFILVTYGMVKRLRNKDLQESAPFARLQRELGTLEGDLADLGDRFTRFQKREGMREAREAKLSKADLEAEALRIVQEKGTGEAGLLPNPTSKRYELYRQWQAGKRGLT
jgi:hypothetical protein